MLELGLVDCRLINVLVFSRYYPVLELVLVDCKLITILVF